jgi:superfamily II DNA or RNA helicase
MTQYAGRLHRHHEAKHEVRIIDYVDHAVPVLRRMYAKRQRAYSSLGYATDAQQNQRRRAVRSDPATGRARRR